METFHFSRNPLVTMLLSLLVSASLGTPAIVTQPVWPTTRAMDVAPALITPAPVVDHQAIFARDNVATCGYVSGKAASPLTCPPSYSCTSTAHFAQGWTCCDQIQCKGNYNICQDYGANLCPNLDDDTCKNIYTSILTCSSAAPSCVTYMRSRSVGDFMTEYSLGCGKVSGGILVLVSTVGAQGDNAAATSAQGGNSAPASSTNARQSTDVFGSSVSSGSTQPTNNPSNTNGGSSSSDNSNSDNNKSNKLSMGELIAIVVSIVAMILAVVVGWWKRHQVLWCCTCGWRGHKHSEIDGHEPSGNPLRPMPPRYNGEYGPVNTQPDYTPYHSNPNIHIYTQASNPSISTPPMFHTGRPAPTPAFRGYGGN